ncbi:hypothetical protein J6590_070565 [Homalodisca vitripennis]|nr:hypothetical protein J6590_070565 [Homalodisca vitripennis]
MCFPRERLEPFCPKAIPYFPDLWWAPIIVPRPREAEFQLHNTTNGHGTRTGMRYNIYSVGRGSLPVCHLSVKRCEGQRSTEWSDRSVGTPGRTRVNMDPAAPPHKATLRPCTAPCCRKHNRALIGRSWPAQPSPTPGTAQVIAEFIMDDEDDDLSDGEPAEPERNPRPNPWHRTGTTDPPAPLTREEYHHYCDTALECTLPPQSACRVTAGCRIL